MHDDSTDDWDGTEELRPFDQLLRQVSRDCPLPDPPDGLCHRTLERCLMHSARPADGAGGVATPAPI